MAWPKDFLQLIARFAKALEVISVFGRKLIHILPKLFDLRGSRFFIDNVIDITFYKSICDIVIFIIHIIYLNKFSV